MTWGRRLRLALLSIVGQLFISHIFVGVLTTLLLVLLLTLIISLDIVSFSPDDYTVYAENAAVAWLMPDSDSALASHESENINFIPPGYVLVVSQAHQVVFTQWDSPCRVGVQLADCAPFLINRPVGKSFIDINGEQWVEIVLPLATGERVIARFARPTPANVIAWIPHILPNLLGVLFQTTIIVMVVSIPASALLVWLFARPLLRRIARIAQASQKFADGDLMARVRDGHRDEVSHLAQQFDSMADALQQNIFVLRDLLKTNAALTAQVETTAIQTERLRLARDLHDDLAQRLFSLAVSSAAIPELIERDATAGAVQAKQVALLAEQTLVGLRSLLVDLRPGGLLERGLPGGVKQLCDEWGQAHRITIDLSILLRSDHLAAPLQTALYHIIQESLNNIAKHARANQVVISLVEGRQQIVLSISDNGLGFTAATINTDGHFGLLTMRERAESFGGTLSIESETGQGTTVRAVIPVQDRL